VLAVADDERKVVGPGAGACGAKLGRVAFKMLPLDSRIGRWCWAESARAKARAVGSGDDGQGFKAWPRRGADNLVFLGGVVSLSSRRRRPQLYSALWALSPTVRIFYTPCHCNSTAYRVIPRFSKNL